MPTASKMAAIEIVTINSTRVKPPCIERERPTESDCLVRWMDAFAATNILITMGLYLLLISPECKQCIYFEQYFDDGMRMASDERQSGLANA
ncbi:hypothetical protein [Herminiimonas sp. CN]|uniref:hypothetical protein n=1 Tax=Herminiimonas sp. CN TaxID=1349818 RepID=UPI001EE641F4|nr:hypothetical protein [Herminiimonas sp. CN]